jgi:hypothetical protein
MISVFGKCKLCDKPVAYEGAVFCGSACVTLYEAGLRKSDEALVDALMSTPQPERHMITMPPEVREAVGRLNRLTYDRLYAQGIGAAESVDLLILLAWAREVAK